MAMMATRERRRLCKFIPGWMSTEEFSTWLCPVKGDKHKAYCRLCKKLFAVSHGGLNDVKTHYKGKKHIFLQQQETERSSKQFLTGLWEGSPLKLNTLIYNTQTHELEPTNFSLSSYYEESLEDTSFGSEISKPRSVDSDTELETSQIEMNSHQKLPYPQQYCLRWKYHTNNMQVMFSQWLERESFCDVTLACEGRTLRAHKVVLSACSTYFDTIFTQYEENNPIVILKDVKFADIKALVDFMYRGEINVDHSHLASLLKTAEDLRIKGLAEVSWRADNQEPPPKPEPTLANEDSDTEPPPPKRSREHSTSNNFSSKMMNVSGNVGSEDFTEGISENDVSGWDDSEPEVLPSEYETSLPVTIKQETTEPLNNSGEAPERNNTTSTTTPTTAEGTPTTPNSDAVSQRLAAQYSDVVKLNDYLTTGRRQQFWEEPFTRRIMEAIKSKELEMKAGAELLGVSYGTLYGRYRDAYGCLKHPYRMRDFWSESGPADVLAKVQRKEMTLFRAAEMLNVTVTTLANYLSTLRQSGSGSGGGASSGDDNGGEDSHDSLVVDGQQPQPQDQAQSQQSYSQQPQQQQQSQSGSTGQSSQQPPPMPPLTPAPSAAAAAAAASATAVKLAALANNPDISIVKHEVTQRPEETDPAPDEDIPDDDIDDEDDDDDEGSEDSLVVTNSSNANGAVDSKSEN